jgi:hypothetical protein
MPAYLLRSVRYTGWPPDGQQFVTPWPRAPPAGGGSGGRLSPPGLLATRLARGAVVQLGQRCPRVKRDGTVGLVGCWIRRPPKAAPPSRRVRPQASIALDRTPASRRPPATVGGGEGTRLRRVLLRWQAPQPCRSQPRATVVKTVAPTLDSTQNPTLDPTPATRVPPPCLEAGSSLVLPPRGASRPQKPRPTGPPRGSGAAAPQGALRAIDSSARPRLWADLTVRAAYGGIPCLIWLPRRVVRQRKRVSQPPPSARGSAGQAPVRKGRI